MNKLKSLPLSVKLAIIFLSSLLLLLAIVSPYIVLALSLAVATFASIIRLILHFVL